MEATRLFDPVLRSGKGKTTLLEAAQNLMSTKEKDLVDVGFVDADGNTVKITRDMLLELYFHLQNRQNVMHMMYGITVPGLSAYYGGKEGMYDADNGGKRVYYDSYSAVDELNQISREMKNADPEKAAELENRRAELERDVLSSFDALSDKVEGMLTDYERRFVDCAKEFFEYSSERLNEATVEMYGFEKAKVKNYYPISTDSAFNRTDMETVVNDISVESWGSMKNRIEGARNPMYLNGILNTVSRHMDKMSTYAAMALPMNTFKGIWQTQFSNYRSSMRDAFRNSVYGEQVYNWIENLYADMTGNRKGKGPKILSKIRNNIAPSALMFNVSVMAKQAASYPTAIATVGWGPALKALAKGGKNGRLISRANTDLINTYTPLLWLRSQGLIDPEINDAKNGQSTVQKVLKKIPLVKQFYNFGVNGIQATDMATVGRLWSAAEYYVEDNFPELERGTEEEIKAGKSEFYQKVAEIFNKITEETQPDYTTLQRPDILRNPDSLIKSLTMFMTQRLQNFQIGYYAIDQWRVADKMYRANQTEENKAALKNARKNAVNGTSALLTSTIVIGVMTWLGGKWLLHKPWRDDDDEVTVASTLQGILESCLESLAGNILGGTELYNALKSAFTGQMYYGVEAQNIALFSDTVDAAVGTINWIKEKGFNASASEWAEFFLHGKASKLINYVSQMFGVPTQQIRNLFTAAFQHASDAVGMIEGKYDRWWMTGANYDDARLLVEYIIDDKEEAAEYRYNELVESEIRKGKSEEEAKEEAAKDVKAVVKDMFLNGDLSVDDAIHILTGKCVGMNSNDAYWATDEWQETKKHEGDEGWSYSKYHVLRDSIDSGKLNLQDAYGYYTGHGVSKDAVRSEAKEYIARQFEAGNISESSARSMLSRYWGDDAAADTISGSKCYIATGVRYGNLSEAYINGDISASTAKAALVKYGGKTEEEANTRVQYWDFKKQYPDADISEEKVAAYYNNNLTVPMKAYITYCTKSKNVHGVDADGDGKTDSGSKKAAMLVVIDELPISNAQKDELYYLNGWAASKIYEAPWH